MRIWPDLPSVGALAKVRTRCVSGFTPTALSAGKCVTEVVCAAPCRGNSTASRMRAKDIRVIDTVSLECLRRSHLVRRGYHYRPHHDRLSWAFSCTAEAPWAHLA
jgi:hypothetical protein